MNKFQKIGLAVVFALGVSFADALWDIDAVGGQVQFPWIVDCWETGGGDPLNSEDPCYKDVGGWWYGFVAGPNQGDAACPDPRGEPGYKSTNLNKVEAKIGDNWVSIVGPDFEPDCQGPPITDPESGDTYLKGNGLELRFTVGPGIAATYKPDLAVVAVNLWNPPYAKETDMSKYAEGFYLKYESNHTADHDLALELGWDEGIEGTIYGYDTWLAPIPPGTGVQRKEFKWAKTSTAGGCTLFGSPTCQSAGDFEQDGWDTGAQGATLVSSNTINTAVTKMQSVKIRLKSMSGTAPDPVLFKLIEFGFVGNPDPFPVPVVRKGTVQAAANFGLQGKMLSMSPVAKPVSVQIINLQGALVHSQTLAGGSINLSHLPAGVYIVRSPALGYSSRIMLK